jgi:hypothetical protein
MLEEWNRPPQVREISDEQLYQRLEDSMREAISNAIWPVNGSMDQLYRSIELWQKNLSILPEKQREQFLARLSRAMGVNSHLPK